MAASDSNEQPTQPNHPIQLKFTIDDPDKPIARKVTYSAPPAWRHLLKKVEKLFSINFDAIQIIYPLECVSSYLVYTVTYKPSDRNG